MNFKEFLKESNKIEGIFTEITTKDVKVFENFMKLPLLTVNDLCNFVNHFEPRAVLRNKKGLDVKVGNYFPSPGGEQVEMELNRILTIANVWHLISSAQKPYEVHYLYEKLHPFTDCNGRSGRAIWAWMRGSIPDIGFLHSWYYQSLQYSDYRRKSL